MNDDDEQRLRDATTIILKAEETLEETSSLLGREVDGDGEDEVLLGFRILEAWYDDWEVTAILKSMFDADGEIHLSGGSKRSIPGFYAPSNVRQPVLTVKFYLHGERKEVRFEDEEEVILPPPPS
eukprot:Trichotokara_eunicae@DN3151_c0_g1_i1.p1